MDMATISVRGVITSPIDTSSSRMTFETTCHSSSSRVPSLRPMLAKTSSSARLIVGRSVRGVIRLVRRLSGRSTGFIATTMIRSIYAAGFASCFQYEAPMVFGTISEKTRTARVRPAEKMPIGILWKTSAATAPPMVAPMVCAIVLRVRIAAMGSSTFF